MWAAIGTMFTDYGELNIFLKVHFISDPTNENHALCNDNLASGVTHIILT
jgi:hypothetical protein